MKDEREVREMLLRRANTVPATPVETATAVKRARRRLVLNGAVATVAAVAIVVAAFTGVDAIRSAPIPAVRPTPTPTPTPTRPSTSAPPLWSPVLVHDNSGVHRGALWHDPRDTPVDWVDVTRVRYSTQGGNQPTWYIKLAATPPPVAGLEPGRLIAYGLVLETTGDEVADYLIGIDNDAPEPGDFHVWVTDLAKDETDEQIGPNYGLPIEFRHPDEWSKGDNLAGPDLLLFTFIAGLPSPPDLNMETVRFYAWAGAARNGEIVALDYAPDTDWMTLT